ncbi:MAG: hypothetical protein DPW09_22215 [Anaerolineae bacterium]|nr:hypothetical protein [Anaerolineae bacterium]
MKKMLQLFVVIFILTGIALGAWYAGGIALAVTLGVLGLTGLIAIAFLLGSHWTYRLLREGSRIAIDSLTVSEQADAIKTKALTNLVTETVKQFKPSGAAASETPKFPAVMPLLPGPTDQPPLLPDYVGPIGFTIAGLDEDELEQTDDKPTR